jgi:GNAT superfamily N-acetyltransferase
MSLKPMNREDLQFLSNYSSDTNKREQLYPLFEKVFGMDSKTLKDFYKRGLWSGAYTPYTYFIEDQAIANVSIFPLGMKIKKTVRNCVGIQSVMTDPSFRKQGLMKKLFSQMLEDVDKLFEGAFLFTSQPELYTRYGFQVVDQYFFRIHFDHSRFEQKIAIRQLDPFNDDDLTWLKRLFKEKEPLSNVFAPITYEHPLYFNLYNPELNSKFFLIEELETVIVFDILGEALRLFDIISPKIPPLETLCSYLPYTFKRIEFYFNPDLLHLADVESVIHHTKNKLMFRGSLQLENKLIMPFTAEF